VTLWRDAARKAPTTSAYFNLGNALRERGDCVRAIPAYKNAIRLTPSFVPSYPDLGACLIELGRLEEARRVLTAALELDPALAATHESLAALARVQGSPDTGSTGRDR
jgi:tetratricopeptide (TPR) repeat protein